VDHSADVTVTFFKTSSLATLSVGLSGQLEQNRIEDPLSVTFHHHQLPSPFQFELSRSLEDRELEPLDEGIFGTTLRTPQYPSLPEQRPTHEADISLGHALLNLRQVLSFDRLPHGILCLPAEPSSSFIDEQPSLLLVADSTEPLTPYLAFERFVLERQTILNFALPLPKPQTFAPPSHRVIGKKNLTIYHNNVPSSRTAPWKVHRPTHRLTPLVRQVLKTQTTKVHGHLHKEYLEERQVEKGLHGVTGSPEVRTF
jgi:hypothetical protein